jgi:hypothetical protein
MKLLKGWKIKILTGLALASMGGQLHAQKPGSIDPALLGRGPATPVSYRYPGQAQESDMSYAADPNMSSMDPNLPAAGCGPGGYGFDGYVQGCGPECNGNCGGHGCGIGGCGALGCTDMFGRDRCGFFDSIAAVFGSCRGKLRPYGEGGIATQRWFDISGEAVFLKRTKGLTNFNTTSLGAGTNNFVLSTSQVDFDDVQAGLGLQANLQTGPGSNLEVVYFGLHEWQNSATVTSTTPSLFSFMSAFGTVPVNGFDDSDRSLVQSLEYASQLNNGELNFRRRWSEPHGFFQGSFLAGVRYLDLDESCSFRTRGEFDDTFLFNSPRYMDYTVNTQNSLVGFQVGADLWYNLIPGVKIGTEGKTGVYNNRAHQVSTIIGNSINNFNNPFTEEVLSNRCAYVSQFNTQLVYRLNYSWAFRTSYQCIYIDGVALAPENFNPVPPDAFFQPANRVASISNDAEILLQGFTVGAEYTW